VSKALISLKCRLLIAYEQQQCSLVWLGLNRVEKGWFVKAYRVVASQDTGYGSARLIRTYLMFSTLHVGACDLLVTVNGPVDDLL
jgi:hypothetical protein